MVTVYPKYPWYEFTNQRSKMLCESQKLRPLDAEAWVSREEIKESFRLELGKVFDDDFLVRVEFTCGKYLFHPDRVSQLIARANQLDLRRILRDQRIITEVRRFGR